MEWKVKKAPAPPKAEAKAKALKAKIAVLKGLHSHKKKKKKKKKERKKEKKIRKSPTFQQPKTLRLRRQLKYPQKSSRRRNKHDHYAIKFPLTTESDMKIEDNTFVFIVDVKANKHENKQSVKKLYDSDVAKVNTLIRPDGEKAYVRLDPDCHALDVANKTGIIYTESSPASVSFGTIQPILLDSAPPYASSLLSLVQSEFSS
ncbi:large ribosomal subunit protein uL23-like [Camelus bactrianus]|uniref:large ribosomal subunit protein uL23-like n=1 Tax=Camelus bactrianus TaxID=9837 RepID=UPI003D6EF9A9